MYDFYMFTKVFVLLVSIVCMKNLSLQYTPQIYG